MKIAIFGNAMKSETLREVQHILEFMEQKGVHVLLSQELRQELNLREYPSFPDKSISELGISELVVSELGISELVVSGLGVMVTKGNRSRIS